MSVMSGNSHLFEANDLKTPYFLFTGRHKNKQCSGAKIGFKVSASVQVGPSDICASCDVIEVLIEIGYIAKLIHF
jgi:hypothetical protein